MMIRDELFRELNGMASDDFHLNAFFSDEPHLSAPKLPPSTSSDGDSHDDSEVFSDIVLSYINQMLMEEDADEKLDMLQEHPALLAAEKPFYDILADTQSSSSSEQPLSALNHTSYGSSDDSLSPHGRNHVSDIAEELFNLGADAARKFLPIRENLTIGLPATGGEALVGNKKSHKDDNLEAEEDIASKQSAVSMDSDVPPEMFDVLLCKDYNGKCQVDRNNSSHGEKKSQRRRRRRKGERNDSVDLNSLLIQCAEAVSNNELRQAYELLNQIRRHSSPSGDASQRVAHCFANALEARLAGGTGSKSNNHPSTPPAMSDMLKAYQLFVAASPFKKISAFFAHQTIMNVSEKAGRLHIIDLGIYHGFLWPCFMQRLSTRPGGPPALRITGIDVPQPGFRPAEHIEETGQRLSGYARKFGIPFDYRAVACNWEALRAEELRAEGDEVVAVTCMYRLQNLADETVSPDSPRDRVLRMIRRLRPEVFVVGVVNGAYNAPFFMTRFREALFHFSAVMDMLETNAGGEEGEEQRRLLERVLFEREATNVVSCEGAERVERPETYKQWRARNERAGLQQMELNEGIMRRAREKVGSCYHRDFLVDEDGKWLLQGWKGRILLPCRFGRLEIRTDQ